jgi:hypothetical protein
MKEINHLLFSGECTETEVNVPHDGSFHSYSTFDNHPDHREALELLETLAAIVDPVMKRHNITVHCLAELHISANYIYGQHFVFPKDPSATRGWEIITIRLRDGENRGRFLPLEHLLGTLTLELAHCWYGNYGLLFLRKWRELMSEVEMVLDGNIRIEPRTDVQKKQLRWL